MHTDWWIGDADPHYSNNGNKLQISKCLFRVLLSLAQMQNLGPIYKTKMCILSCLC
jgi:hypothetical protein